ncbi:MAG: hypothetical protein R3A46_09800 [Thermomicrobiales bacterium]
MHLTRLILGMFLIVALLAGCITRDDDDDEVSGDGEQTSAIEAAMAVYEDAVDSGVDLSKGPCIAEELEEVPGWSVDIAHDPRQEVDNDPANQCQAYRDGQTSHFVELNPEGELIRAQ